MKVKATLNLGGLDYPDHMLTNGEVAEVPDAVGRLMVQRLHAIEIVIDEPPTEEPKPDKFTQARAEHPKTKVSK